MKVNNMDEEQYNDIDAIVDDVPGEVQDFLFGEDMEQVFRSLDSIIQNSRVSEDLRINLEQVILGIKSIDDLDVFIKTLPLSQDQQVAIRHVIQNDVFDELLTLTSAADEAEQKQNDMQDLTARIDAPSPADVLETIRSRLTEAKTIAPSARSVDVAPTPVVPPTEEKKPLDPYREEVK